MEFKPNAQLLPSALTVASNALSIPLQYSYSSFISSASPFHVNTCTSPFSLTCANTPSPFSGFVSPFTQYLNYQSYPSFTPLTPLTPASLCPGTSSAANTFNSSPTLCSPAAAAAASAPQTQNVPHYSPLPVSSCAQSLQTSLLFPQTHSSSSARTQPPPPNVCVSSDPTIGFGCYGAELATRFAASRDCSAYSRNDALLLQSSFAGSQSSWIAPTASAASSLGAAHKTPFVRATDLQAPQEAEAQSLKRQFEPHKVDKEHQQWAVRGRESGLGADLRSSLVAGPFTSDAVALSATNAPTCDVGGPRTDQFVYTYDPQKYQQYDPFFKQECDRTGRTREATSCEANARATSVSSSKRARITTAAASSIAFERPATPPAATASGPLGAPQLIADRIESPEVDPGSGRSYDMYQCPTSVPVSARSSEHHRQQRGLALGYGHHGFHMDCSEIMGRSFDADYGLSGIEREPEHLVKPPFSYIALITMVCLILEISLLSVNTLFHLLYCAVKQTVQVQYTVHVYSIYP